MEEDWKKTLAEIMYLYNLDKTYTLGKEKNWEAKLPIGKGNRVLVMPSALVDPTVSPMAFFGLSNPMACALRAGSGTSLSSPMNSTQIVYSFGIGFEWVRTPNIFKSVGANTAAATAVWTPAAGKKFRLMGGVITSASAALAAAALTTLTLLDSAAAITLAFDIWVPITPLNTTPCIAFDLKPNGYLSAVANNVLNATLTANLLSGQIRVTVWGTEE